MTTSVPLDATDLRILKILQTDARAPNKLIAREAGLTVPPYWRRMRRLEQFGIIDGYRAEIRKSAVGLGVTVFVRVRLSEANDHSIAKFSELVGGIAEVFTCDAVIGEADCILEVVTSSIEHYRESVLSSPDSSVDRRGRQVRHRLSSREK